MFLLSFFVTVENKRLVNPRWNLMGLEALPKLAGVIIGLVGLALSVLIHLRQRQLKRIFYQVLSQNTVLEVNNEITSRLKVLLDGQPIANACLAVVKIKLRESSYTSYGSRTSLIFDIRRSGANTLIRDYRQAPQEPFGTQITT